MGVLVPTARLLRQHLLEIGVLCLQRLQPAFFDRAVIPGKSFFSVD